MNLVALVRAPAHPDEAARHLAGAAGLTLAEARMRLAPEPPALLARLEPGPAGDLVTALRRAGVAVVAVPAQVPSDRDRAVARSVAFSGSTVAFALRSGDRLELSPGDVVAVLRGQRSRRTEVERTEKVKRLSLSTAIATGGLVLSRSSTRTERSANEAVEQVLLVLPRSGPAILLAETLVDFSCLGTGMQPSSGANMAELARRLREAAPGAFQDDRLLRLGRRPLPFVAGGTSSSHAGAATERRSDTAGTLDVLAAVLWQGIVEGLLP